MKRPVFVLFVFLCNSALTQTILNAYAKITSVTGNSVLTLSNVNNANHTFTAGGQVIVMQMQDNVIGTNTTNVATFGNLSAIANAGRYEVRTIAAVTPTSGTPTSVTLSAGLINTFNVGTNSSVQLISFRDLGSNYTTTANISGLAWDGNIGGVVAFYVTNTLTLNHAISANGLGFRGGASSNAEDIGCANTVYITNSNLKGFKGEGIYKNTDANLTNGRGKLLSGGGGGSQNNTGGGGGGNYTAGGDGGLGWTCTSGNSGYGLGGISLSSHISASRIFMGGAGGGGQQNNNLGTAGGNGGGIILMKAGRLATSTTCGSSILISADGNSAANSGNDGAGGGGAAGSIILQVSNYAVSATCPLTVTSSGGDGGSVGNSGSHGGGAGGGQGVVIYSTTTPTVNITTQTNNGAGGANNNTGSTTYAGSGSGSNGAGIVAASVGPLPIELVNFTAEPVNNHVQLHWSTASENNNRYFDVEKSSDGLEYVSFCRLNGAGTTHSYRDYSANDYKPNEGENYYRLKQTDYDGTFAYSPVILLGFLPDVDFSFSPNPVMRGEKISFLLTENTGVREITILITNFAGERIHTETLTAEQNNKTVYVLKDLTLGEGVYVMQVQSGASMKVKKLIVK